MITFSRVLLYVPVSCVSEFGLTTEAADADSVIVGRLPLVRSEMYAKRNMIIILKVFGSTRNKITCVLKSFVKKSSAICLWKFQIIKYIQECLFLPCRQHSHVVRVNFLTNCVADLVPITPKPLTFFIYSVY